MWSEPLLLREWCAPAGFTVAEGEGEFRPGGAWSCRMVAPDGTEHRVGGVYQEILAPEKLLTTHAWEDPDGRRGPETLLDVRFEDLDGQTRLVLRQGVFSSEAERDGHLGGWSECLAKLAARLAQPPQQNSGAAQ